MHTTTKGRSLKLFGNHAMLTHQWRKLSFVDLNNWKSLWQGEEMHLSSVNCDKVLPLFEPSIAIILWNEIALKPNWFKWDQQWQHWPSCECHRQIILYQFTIEKSLKKATKEHEFVHMRTYTSHNGHKSIPNNIMRNSLFPTMGTTEKVSLY
jgi:hypothetical protein